MEDKNGNVMRDADLDRLLQSASQPPVPLGAEARLARRIAAVSAVPVYPIAPASKRNYAWVAGVPLAASLALGIYLGTAGLGGSLLNSSTVEEEDVYVTGFEEAELAAEEDLT